MNVTIFPPAKLHYQVALPPSKSVAGRVLAIRYLMKGEFEIENMPECDDTTALHNAILSLESGKTDEIYIGGAGTAMRFLAALLAVTEGEYVVDGNERMRHRPIGELVTALNTLGADIVYLGEEGFPPLRISGRRLEGGCITLRGDVSSQFVSALLLIAPTMKRGLEIRLTGGISSRPYIDLTLDVMHDFGARATWTAGDSLTVEPTPYIYNKENYAIEADWTAASYWFAMHCMSGHNPDSLAFSNKLIRNRQGDSILPLLFQRIGEGDIFEFDFADNPDLVQTMAVCCCACNKSFRFTGLQSLHIKETDRIDALQKELAKCGYNVEVESDEISFDASCLSQTRKQEPVEIDTYGDHRMAMAFATLAIKRPGLVINNAEVVNKSYPNFWRDLRAAGFEIVEQTKNGTGKIFRV